MNITLVNDTITWELNMRKCKLIICIHVWTYLMLVIKLQWERYVESLRKAFVSMNKVTLVEWTVQALINKV